MKIDKTYNTTTKEIESKKFNILLPICVGNRFFQTILPPQKIFQNLEDKLPKQKISVVLMK